MENYTLMPACLCGHGESCGECDGTSQKYKDTIRNLRIQLETHRHFIQMLLAYNDEKTKQSAREFLQLPWGMR